MQTAETSPHPVAAIIKWAVSIIGLLILSASCAWGREPPQSDELKERLQNDELKEHLERWRAHGITNYRMRYQKYCYRCWDQQRPQIVDVRNGVVHGAVYEDDRTPADHFHSIESLDSLFIMIEKSINKQWRKDLVRVRYNAEYGYPETVVFDNEGFHESLGYQVKLLMIVEEDTYLSLHGTPEEIARAIYDEMVSIPVGTFRMGDLSGEGREGEKPTHTATVPAFRLMKNEVTLNQWGACLADGECNDYRPTRWFVGGDHPAQGVSWDDARSFIGWLNRKTGRNYRLPTEAEWEYAARAGSDTKFSWGNDIGSNRANCQGCDSAWDGRQTAPVGSFPANAWGLHDMHGNVGEWVQDCWNDSYQGAPTDGRAWTSGDCSHRVIRGGSWSSPLWYLRSAYRYGNDRTYRNSRVGFRLAHDE